MNDRRSIAARLLAVASVLACSRQPPMRGPFLPPAELAGCSLQGLDFVRGQLVASAYCKGKHEYTSYLFLPGDHRRAPAISTIDMAHIAGVTYCPASAVLLLSDFDANEIWALDQAQTRSLVDRGEHSRPIAAARTYKLDIDRLSAIECAEFRGTEVLVVSQHTTGQSELRFLDAQALIVRGERIELARAVGPRYVQGLDSTPGGDLLVHHNIDLHDGAIEISCLGEVFDTKVFRPHQRFRTTAFPEDVAVADSTIVFAREWASAIYHFEADLGETRCAVPSPVPRPTAISSSRAR